MNFLKDFNPNSMSEFYFNDIDIVAKPGIYAKCADTDLHFTSFSKMGLKRVKNEILQAKEKSLQHLGMTWKYSYFANGWFKLGTDKHGIMRCVVCVVLLPDL